MEQINCPACCNQQFKHVLTGQDNINHIEGNFNIVQCKHCGFLLTNPRPNSKEIVKYYPETYTPYHPNFKQSVRIALFRKQHPIIYNFINPQHNLDLQSRKTKNKVLEVGCGSGNFIFELKTLHPHWEISGSDISKTNIDILKKHKIDAFVSDLTKIPKKTNYFDLIYGWMVMEHVHNLHTALSEIHRVLKKKGVLCISIPNASSWEFTFFKKYWHGLHLPNHLYHFTPKSISNILKINGFQVKKIIFQKNFSNVFSSVQIYINNSRLPKKLKLLLTKILKWNIFYHCLTLPVALHTISV